MPFVERRDAETNVTALNLEVLFDTSLYSKDQDALIIVLNEFNQLTRQILLQTKSDATTREACDALKKIILAKEDLIEARNKLVLKHYEVLLSCQKEESEHQQNAVKRSLQQAHILSNQVILSDLKDQKNKSWLKHVGEFFRYALDSALADGWPLLLTGIIISCLAASGPFILALFVVGLVAAASSLVVGAINSGLHYSRTKEKVEQAYDLAQTTADSLENENRSLTNTEKSIRTVIQSINLDILSPPQGSAQRFFKPGNFETPDNSQVKTQDAQTETGKLHIY